MDHVAGYVVVNDISARDWQGIPPALARGREGRRPVAARQGLRHVPADGPGLRHAGRARPGGRPAPPQLAHHARTAREHLMQDGTTADLIYDVPELIAFISQPHHAGARATSSRPARRPASASSATRRSSWSPATGSAARSRASARSRTRSSTGPTCRPTAADAPDRPARRGTTRAMRALVKTAAGPGLELRDVPEPPMGINDVRIRVRKTGICGTDLHIESGILGAEDDQAAARRRPRVRRRGRSRSAATSTTSAVGDIVSGEGHVVCGRCRHCRAGRWHLCANTIGLGVGRDGAFAEQVVLPVTNVWHHWPRHRPRRSPRSSTRSATRSTPRSRSRSSARTCSSSAPGPIGLMADGRRPPRRRPLRRRQRAQRRSAASSPTRMGATLVVDPRERDLAGRPGASSAWSRASTSSSRCPATPARCATRSANMAHGAGMAILGIPTEDDPARRQPGRLQAADAARHLRPGDVRDLVQDVGDAPVRARHQPGDHPPLLVPRARGGVRRGAVAATPAR